MTGFDLAVIAVIGFSMLLAFARGIVRSLIGLLAWVAGLVGAILLAPVVVVALPAVPEYPLVPYAIAFVSVFLVAIVLGALIAWPIASIVRKAGLGFVDRGLGAVFGLARGVVVIVAFVLLGGFSRLPERDWWQNSLLVPPFERAALAAARWLPSAWAERLHYPERTTGGALRKV